MNAPAPTGRPGTYALVLAADAPRRIRVGRLGELEVRPGVYIYVGSAFGPGGVRARVARHRRAVKRAHWHVDHLRRVTRLLEVWYTHAPARRECTWARAVAALPRAIRPLTGFGASDCDCDTHLYHVPAPPPPDAFRAVLGPGDADAAIRRWITAGV